MMLPMLSSSDSASTRRATSTRRAVATVCGDGSSVLARDRKVVAKRKRRSSADDDEGKKAAKKVARKQYPKICSADGCTNQVIRRGVCKRHGAYHNPHDESTAFTLHGSRYDETTELFPISALPQRLLPTKNKADILPA
jgi:hypothetical protein